MRKDTVQFCAGALMTYLNVDNREITIIHARISPETGEILEVHLVFNWGDDVILSSYEDLIVYGRLQDNRDDRPVAYYLDGVVYLTKTVSQGVKFQIMR